MAEDNNFSDYLNLTRKDLQDMYKIVVDTIPESKKKYEIIQEIIECFIYRMKMHDEFLVSLSKEMKILMTKEELTEANSCRIKQIQLIMHDLYLNT